MKIHIATGHSNFETVALPADKHARLQMLSLAECVSKDQWNSINAKFIEVYSLVLEVSEREKFHQILPLIL